MDPVQFTAMMVLLRQTLTAAMQGGARTAGPDLRLQRLTKMMAEDQPEAYLEVFKVMATSAVWPQAQWANYLLPQLTGEAQAAARTLSPTDMINYPTLMAAISATTWGLPQRATAESFGTRSYERAYLDVI
ncbi:UNVERIFIED_CONTAM: hypothetical protein FKN15_017633 [Acipenser sinensis]